MTPLDRDRIDLWLVFDEPIDDAALFASYRALMSAEERAREQRFVRAQDRRQFVITRALVRTVLSRYVALSPADWQFTTLEQGKPVIENEAARRCGIRFNVAHTQGLILLGVSQERELGVDVERLLQRQASIEIARRYFAPEELAALAALPCELQMTRFFEYWTLKESYIKARGLGLSIPLDQFSFDLAHPGRAQIRMAATLGDEPARWQFWQCQPAPGYALAVCAERRDSAAVELAIQWLDPRTLRA